MAGWQQSLAAAIRDPAELLRALGLAPGALAVASDNPFPLLVPRSYVARMRPGDAADPLLRQVLPLAAEDASVAGFGIDAVEDRRFRRAPGLLQKYQGRALLMLAGTCAINCRYCFRRHYPYAEEPKRGVQWQPALDALRGDASISEVILSGGDPLLLSDRRLAALLRELDAIPHLQRLRIHTRLPVVLPDRVTPALVALLGRGRLAPVVVVHANHAAELEADCAAALARLAATRVRVLNQAVLLRGVNDSVAALAALSERLLTLGALPYYLHQLDRVHGAAHFEVPVDTGLALVRALRARLPGYLVPRYVREIPGEDGKTLLG